MSGEEVVQVTTVLPPYLDGIGDQAVLLAKRLAEAGGIRTRFVAVDPMTTTPEEVEGFPARFLQGRARRELVPELRRLTTPGVRTVIVHYTPVSYDRWSVPAWLARVLRAWRGGRPERRVVVILHEFFSPERSRRLEIPIRSLQREGSRDLVEAATLVVCSNRLVEEQVREMAPAARLLRLPVFSNLLEPDPAPTELEGRDPHDWVTLGSIGRLRRSLEQLRVDLPLLPGWCRPRRLYVGGGTPDAAVEGLAASLGSLGVEVTYRPDVPAAEASAALRAASFCYQKLFVGVRAWHRPLAFKSGIFAAANAHGVVSVFGDRFLPHPAWEPGHPGIVVVEDGRFALPDPSGLPDFQRRLHAWYRENGSSRRYVQALLRAL